MMWLLSLFVSVKKLIGTALQWAIRNPMAAIAALAVAGAAFQTWRLNDARADEKRAVEALAGEKAAHEATIAGYAVAQKAFEKKQDDNLARVAKAQEQINVQTKERYLADVGNWKSRFERLRAKPNRSGPGATCLPAVPDAPGRTDGPGDDPGKPAVAVTIDDLETLVNNSLQAQAMQRWIADQAKVETSE